MRKLSLLLLLAIITIAAKAQNHGVVKAIILDSVTHEPVQLATVSILKLQDTSLISYTVTDKNGVFALHNLRQQTSRLLISHVGYNGLRINVDFSKGETVDLGKLYLSAKMLQEVVVKGERIPVIMKKDTIEFDAEAFKTRPNALVEDLLKKLPGMQVSVDGHVTVNGKDVSKIKVNGKDFFINDPTIATRNLEAEMISKVQVYDDRENDPDHLQPDYQVKKIINLKFKKEFLKAFLSNMGVGAGTQDRYTASGFFAKYKDDLQIGGSVYSNNLSGTDFSGLTIRMPGLSGFNGQGGVSKITVGSVSINKNLSKKVTLNINYEFNNHIIDNISASKQQQFIGDTTFLTFSNSKKHDHNNDQHMHTQLEWKPDSVTSLKFEPDLTYGYNSNNNLSNYSNSNTFIPLITTNTTDAHGTSNSFQYQHNINYYHRLNKNGASLTFSNAISIHPENSRDFNVNNLISYVAALQSDTTDRFTKNTNRAISENVSAVYHYPMSKKLSADFIFAGNHNRNAGDLFTYDEDLNTGLYTIFLQNQSSNLIRNQWQQTFLPQLTYNFTDDVSLKLGLGSQLNQISNQFNTYTATTLNQNYFYLLPVVELRLRKFNISYSDDIRQPSISDMQPVTIVYSPIYSFIGNPNLKPSRSHNLGFNYNNYGRESQVSMGISSRFTVETNSIIRENFITADGAKTVRPVNLNGSFNTYLSGYISKRFKKQGNWQLGTSTNVFGAAGHYFFQVNQQNGYQNTRTVTLSQDFEATYGDIFEIRPQYSINPAVTTYQNVDYKSTSYTVQHAGLNFSLFVPQKYTWLIDYTYSYNPLVAPGFRRNSNLLSLALTRRIQKKDRGELKLTCYDLLNQSVNSIHFASGNTINDTQSLLLRRYFMFSYTYHFKDFR
ncbi:outer membrane beta-barrel protein [Mucilaginibacter sp.]|uniref:outer membrane beta-barrel protein n=1 Tax=Mucilaginibacter sp. TaxID=1882438 RepID=UPI0025E94521|nr:outer membrane beta-barrel protein [Mucilaginibacter sp.]